MKRVWLALFLTIALGIASRTVRLGWDLWDKGLGDSLYAVAVYLVLVLVTRWRPFPEAFSTATLICLGIELFKLTGIPRQLSHSLIARWLLGTTFSLHNVPYYVAGIAAIAAIDRYYLRRK